MEAPRLKAQPDEEVNTDMDVNEESPSLKRALKTPLLNVDAVMDPFNRPHHAQSFLKKSPTAFSPEGTGWAQETPENDLLVSWLTALGAALPLVLLSYSSCVSYAHLIVSGAGGVKVPATVIMAMHLFSSGFTGLILPLRSRCPLIVPSADITVTLFYQRVVMDIAEAAEHTAGLSPATATATALLAIPLNTILMSMVFYLVGERKLTMVISYLPYPVVAGFLGSVGWAIFSGSFGVLSETAAKHGVAAFPQLARDSPGPLACAVSMAIGSQLLRKAGLPARVMAVAPTAAALLGFWACANMLGESSGSLRESGWLFPVAEEVPFWDMWTVQRLDLVDWNLLPPKVSTFFGLGFVLVLSLTLRIAGIESSTGASLSIDDEVKWTGIASAGAGLCGAVIGSHSPGLTTFNLEAGSTDVRAAVLTAVLQLALWLSGLPVMNLFPRFLLCGILMNLGLVMLKEWMWTARRKVGLLGLLVIYAQVVSSAVLGLLPSVLVGVVVALLTAQAQLMDLHVLKYHVSGSSIRANVRRSYEDLAVLKSRCDLINALGLEGFLSEGPMIKFTDYVKQYVERNSAVRFMIFDFRACQGCNVSACALLSKLDKVLQNASVRTFYSNVESEMAKTLQSFGVVGAKIFHSDSATATSFLLALQRCEDLVIADAQPTLRTNLSSLLPPAPLCCSVKLVALEAAVQEFLGCSQEQVATLSAAGTWSEKPAGFKLSGQGRLEEVLHIAVPGHSEVTEMIDVGASCGPAQQVSVTRLGALCGCEGLLFDEESRSTCTVSAERSRFLAVQKQPLKDILAADPSLASRLTRTATLQFLRNSDALMQSLQLNQGGGWHGGHFDRRTAEVSMKLVEDFSTLRSPTATRPKLRRRGTINGWAEDWVRQRSDAPHDALPQSL